ncbi:MAG: hypothetical protein CM1200mP18_20690 [Gammaproteobacteria bacterium]|nr:MAG: hypothetical protein CM1200mP18_20690 [Gammaproteobacteria bacterium]
MMQLNHPKPPSPRANILLVAVNSGEPSDFERGPGFGIDQCAFGLAFVKSFNHPGVCDQISHSAGSG